MLQSLKQLQGQKLGASDGAVGHVEDFYFEDERWVVRYVVADTGTWLSGRVVLLSPHAFGDLRQDGDRLTVNLSRRQIEQSPGVESHKTVSRQYEEEYYRYYGWPSYWNGDGIWGASGLPTVPPPNVISMMEASREERVCPQDAHLRSAHAMNGYHIATHEGALGHVCDFLIDPQSWAIVQLVVETGHWFSGKQIVIAPSHVERVSYEDSTVFVDLTQDTIRQAEEFHLLPAAIHDTKNFDD